MNTRPSIDIGFSPCPNDTFMFHALISGRLQTESTARLTFSPHIHDVEELNQKAFARTYPITKLSYFAYLRLKKDYDLLDAGSALGYGCGPLLVAKSPSLDVTQAKIAVPGDLTTAHLLMRLWCPDIEHIEITRFDKILPKIASGEYDAGVIIHEGRFVYPEYGLCEIIDLGKWWEEETHLPIPLGCIAILRESESYTFKTDIETRLKSSIDYARNNPNASRAYVRSHAQEMADDVIDNHIRLYVNPFSQSLGEIGRNAVNTLEEMARCKNLI